MVRRLASRWVHQSIYQLVLADNAFRSWRFGLGGSIPAIRQGRQRRSERSRRRQTGGQEAEKNRLRPLSTKPLPTAATRRRALALGHLAVVREADPGRTVLTEDAVLPVHGEVLGAGSPP